MKILYGFLIILFITIGYGLVGTDGNVAEIKDRAPKEMLQRNWKVLRYEGYQWGSFDHHGGSVWYHVENIDNPNIQYRVKISMWNKELQYYYGEPEVLDRTEINLKDK
jgi:hypothetical protein